MQGHRRRRETQRSSATSISPKGGDGTASISLSLLLRDAHDIASSLLRELDAVALATNVTIFMERGTYPRAQPHGCSEPHTFPLHGEGPQAKACGSDRVTRNTQAVG